MGIPNLPYRMICKMTEQSTWTLQWFEREKLTIKKELRKRFIDSSWREKERVREILTFIWVRRWYSDTIIQWYTFKMQTKRIWKKMLVFHFVFVFADDVTGRSFVRSLVSSLSLPLFTYQFFSISFFIFVYRICATWLNAVHPLMRATQNQEKKERDCQKKPQEGENTDE